MEVPPEYLLAEKAARERWGDRVRNVNYKRRGGYIVFLRHPNEDAHVLLEEDTAFAREGSLPPPSGSSIRRVRRKVTPKPAEESLHANLDHGDQGALYAPEAGSIPAPTCSHHSAPTSPPASPLARAQKELEEAAGALVDQWSLIEVGGNVRREDRLSAERRLRRGVTAVRALRLSGGR